MGMIRMGNKRWIVYVIAASLFVAITSHLFILSEWLGGSYFVGIRDGMSQMLPFKQLLYDNYTSGVFFYSDIFGMGGGVYSQLGYYYSTSIVFLLTVIVTYGLETLGIIGQPDLSYWANAVIFVSMIRMIVMLCVATLYIRYVGFQTKFAFVGAVLYATSTIYFRHVVYWEFFADAMIWLPLLLLAVERIIRGKSMTLFIVIVGVSMIDNFYFAYINFLLGFMYIVFRNIFRFETDVRTISAQAWRYLVGGVVGFALSAFSFIPSVYGFLQNDRPVIVAEAIELFAHEDNPLLNGRVIVIPAIIVASVAFFSMYRSRVFRMFAFLTITMGIMHMSPVVASIFNGFSAPQYRWEYGLVLIGGVLVAHVLTNIQSASKRTILSAMIGASLVYLYAYVRDSSITFASFEVGYLLLPAVLTLLVLGLFLWKRSNALVYVLMVTVVCSSIWVANGFQFEKVTFAGTNEEVTKKWARSDAYNGADQQELIDLLHVWEKDPLMRIDWMIPERNNTPLVQEFRGFSAYSSILNQHVLHFYWHDLMIDMGRESVSRYGTLGDRTNLFSLLYGKYVVNDHADESIPFGFEEVAEVGSYIAYENTLSLPFVRTTSHVYAEESLRDAHPIERERAMIDGVVLADQVSERSVEHLEAEEVDVTFEAHRATYEDQVLTVDEGGRLDLQIGGEVVPNGDYYVSFYLKRQDKDQGYPLTVNEYSTTRKKNSSIYRTGVDDVVIRVAAAETISLTVPEGEYELRDVRVHMEDYARLIDAVDQYEHVDPPKVVMDKQDYHISLNNSEGDAYAIVPIPFEKGWKASVNGKEADVLQANYAFTAIPLEDGENTIVLTYTPPFLFVSGIVSMSTLIGLGIVLNRRRK